MYNFELKKKKKKKKKQPNDLINNFTRDTLVKLCQYRFIVISIDF